MRRFWLIVLCIPFLLTSSIQVKAWEGDDGGLDQWEVTVGRYAERLNNAQQLSIPISPPSTTTISTPPHYEIWLRLQQCETSYLGWSANTGNGFYGGLQFTLESWRGVGESGYPHQHSALTQMWAAERLLDLQGWGAWPACSRKLGLR